MTVQLTLDDYLQDKQMKHIYVANKIEYPMTQEQRYFVRLLWYRFTPAQKRYFHSVLSHRCPSYMRGHSDYLNCDDGHWMVRYILDTVLPKDLRTMYEDKNTRSNFYYLIKRERRSYGLMII